MPLFSSTRRSLYEPIEGTSDEDSTQRGLPYEDGDAYHTFPPAMHQTTSIAFAGSTTSELSNPRREHRWDHIKNVDEFFTLVYDYHQGNGFLCIVLKNCLTLFQFIFVVILSTFMSQCVDYDVLFHNTNVTTDGTPIVGKRHFNDAVVANCASHFDPLVVLALLLAIAFWVTHVVRVGMRMLQIYEIQTFFHSILEIPDWELSNAQWREVVERICKKQPELHFIINQEELTPLDIYQRILRHKNYMVALIDNDVLPLHFRVPLVGHVSYMSSGLRINLDWLLFWGAWAPWKSCYELKDELKNGDHLQHIAEELQRTVLYMGIVNLILFPFVFLYQILFGFFSYAELLRREPGVLGSRRYSNYGRLRLRHYNELDHELNSRLSRSYEFAVRYMDQFITPTTEIGAKLLAFVCGSIFGVLFVLSIWDEDVLSIEHVLTVMTLTGAIGLMCRSFIPSENMVFCQDFLMRQVVSNVHYAPTNWIRDSRSTDVCAEFGRIFQLKAQFFAEELLSPLITPFVLLFSVRTKVASIVLFLNENTRNLEAIGDVCKFSMMDVTRDGDPRVSEVVDFTEGNAFGRRSPRKQPAKVELSLLNFVAHNPHWSPPARGEELIRNIRDMWARDLQQVVEANNSPVATALAPLLENHYTRQESDLKARLPRAPGSAARGANPDDTQTQRAASTSASHAATSCSTFQPLGEARDTDGLRSMMRSSVASGMFADSAAAALSAASVYSPHMQHSGGVLLPTARYAPSNIPANVQESNRRALDMSMNALAVTDLLMSRGSGAFAELAALGARSTYVPAAGGDAAGLLLSENAPFRRSAQTYASPTVSFSQRGGATNAAISNIWGVPEESQLLDAPGGLVHDDDDDLERVARREAGDNDGPPHTFNV